MEAKRIGFLLVWMLLIGIVLVHLQTLHKQQVYEMTNLVGRQESLERKIYDQQMELSRELEVPSRLREKIRYLELDIVELSEDSARPSVMVAPPR